MAQLNAQTFSGESVAYDSVANRFFTSDDGTSILQRSSNGSVTHFGSGLTASYGMEVMDGKLFVISGNHVYAYDLSSETQVADANITAATFLNGLASNGANLCWATDFSANKIYQIDYSNLASPVITTLIASTGCQPNGIAFDGNNNRLVFTCWGSNAQVKKVDLSNNAVSTLTTTTVSNIDGVDFDSQGNFFISSWSPDRITKYNSDFTSTPFTVTAPGLNNPADICYAKAIDTLAIPNSTVVTFVGFNPLSISELENEKTIELFGNPVTENSSFSFFLTHPQNVSLEIFSIDGQLVYSLINEKLSAGQHKVLMQNIQLSTGEYVYSFRADAGVVTSKFLVQ